MVKIKIIILSIILLIILSFNVSAFGVSSPYWDENPLYVQPGETKDVTMILQNMVGDQDLKMVGSVNSGNEIMTITDEITTYDVPLGVNNVPVHLKITIPEDAKPGQQWQVGLSFKNIPDNAGGVSIGGEIQKGFPVIIKEEPEVSTSISKVIPQTTTLGFIILVIILIILILVIKHFYKGKKQKDDK